VVDRRSTTLLAGDTTAAGLAFTTLNVSGPAVVLQETRHETDGRIADGWGWWVKVRRQGSSRDAGPDLSGEQGLRDAWDAHASELYGYARRVLGDADSADEMVQETFLRAWRAADRYEPSRPLRPWLFTILRNVVVDESRARRIRAVPTSRDASEAWEDGDDTELMLDRAMDGWLVEEALRRIRPEHAVILLETYLRGRSYAQVAEELDIPVGTARSRAFYGLRALRVELEGMGWEP
jgi:RNA polymerase sigma-70 factor (ECF subfamily)